MLIVDMPIPKNCSECEAKCVSALYGRICGMTRKNIMPFLDKTNRPDWCPIKGELVRCKDCNWFKSGIDINGKPFTKCIGANGSVRTYGHTEPDWFCADGERKDGESDA